MRSRLAKGVALAALVLACGAGRAAAEPIPFRHDAEAVSGATLLRTALALGVVIALGIGAVYALKRWLPRSLGGPGGGGRIQVVEVRRVTPRLTLLLVEIDGRKIALAQSGERVQRLDLGPPP